MFSRLLGLIKPANKPKYRLVPETSGSYTLERWSGGADGQYLCESIMIKDKEEADIAIANLERDVIYYRCDE
jgi:hypothetical protein